MSKDAYYFPHDANAQNDPKILNMIEELGPEGVGIFWMLIEMLRDQQDYQLPITIIPGLSRRWNTTKDKILTVVKRYGLFDVNEDKWFYSNSLKTRMERVDSLRERLAEAGRKGGLSKAKAKLQHPSSIKEKQNKEKESKEVTDIVIYLNEKAGKTFKPYAKPTVEQIKARIKEGYGVDDFKKVIDVKVGQWNNDLKMKKFVRPETLFGTKFESYLNEAPINGHARKATYSETHPEANQW